MSAFDASEFRKAISGAGTDSRAWISYGIVDAASGENKSVTFDDELGPMITVTLMPSRTTIYCRVGSQNGGDLETQYSPFIEGDEVLVAMPQGQEDAGCVIIQRLNNGVDKWPATIAGHDIKTNEFEVERGVIPKLIERTSGYVINHGPSSSWFGYVNNGDWCSSTKKSQIFQSEKAMGFVNADGDCGLQMDHSSKLAFAFSGSSRMDIGSSGASMGTPSAGIVCGSAPNGATAPPATGGVVTDELLAALLSAMSTYQEGLEKLLAVAFGACTPLPAAPVPPASLVTTFVGSLGKAYTAAISSATPYASTTVKATP